MSRKHLIVLFFLAFAPPLAGQGLLLLSDTAFAQLQDDGQPCPPECVTDSMEIVTWYPSPYNEYEELRLYPKHSAEESQCNSFAQLGLMYYNQDEYALKICRQDPDTFSYGWEKIGEGFWKLSGNDILNTNSGNVGIGTSISSTAKLTVSGIIESSSGGFRFPDGTIQTTTGIPSGYAWVTGLGAKPLLIKNNAPISSGCSLRYGGVTGSARNNNGTIQTKAVSSVNFAGCDSGWINGTTVMCKGGNNLDGSAATATVTDAGVTVTGTFFRLDGSSENCSGSVVSW